jgi:hypothetical protein
MGLPVLGICRNADIVSAPNPPPQRPSAAILLRSLAVMLLHARSLVAYYLEYNMGM